MESQLNQVLPWWIKIGAKCVLSRLRFAYPFWQTLGLFRHGRMDTADYAISIFDTHVARARLTGQLSGKTILELGPGDSVATAIIAAAHGARTILIDNGAFAHRDASTYRSLAETLRRHGLTTPDLSDCTALDEILHRCNGQYLTQGLESMKGIPDHSVDLIFSQAVLEHIRADDFDATLQESRRVLRPSGLCSHRVDLKDHLSNGLNNLRFSRRIWESEFFARSGFYTNRLRYGQMLEAFSNAGFFATSLNVNRWETMPISRGSLSQEFRHISDDELLISGFDVLLHKQPHPRDCCS